MATWSWGSWGGMEVLHHFFLSARILKLDKWEIHQQKMDNSKYDKVHLSLFGPFVQSINQGRADQSIHKTRDHSFVSTKQKTVFSVGDFGYFNSIQSSRVISQFHELTTGISYWTLSYAKLKELSYLVELRCAQAMFMYYWDHWGSWYILVPLFAL